MAIELDPVKDAKNVAKHGYSLERAAEVEFLAVTIDDRKDYGETRFRVFGKLDGVSVCLVCTYRGSDLRPISLRRAHAKEMKRYVRT